MAKIIAMGSALVDVITLLEDDDTLNRLSLPKGSMQLVDANTSAQIESQIRDLNQNLTCGGSAANTIRALAKLGIKTGYLGKTGIDRFGDFFEKNMHECGVVPHIIKSETSTGVALALVSKDSERTFATYLGAASELSADDILPTTFTDFDILHIEGYLVFNHELIEKAIQTAKENGLKISLDMASYNIVKENLEFLRYLTEKYVDILFANEEEAKAFTGKEPEEALEIISHICDIAVVKIGSEGSFVKKGNYIHQEKALKINPVDSTGAGDYYAAGFLYGLVNNWDLSKCAKAGTILAGNVMEFIGPALTEERWRIVKENIGKL
ncbi:MAG: adenosine kinase [Bacteroidales bacterium]|jgi:sugar/nucleoside kinase (ribokinase family)|nr:adenosine kinase [Bacteroidales bacterium]